MSLRRQVEVLGVLHSQLVVVLGGDADVQLALLVRVDGVEVRGHLPDHDAGHGVDEEAGFAVDGPAALFERSAQEEHGRDDFLVPEPLPPALGDDVGDALPQLGLRRGGEVVHDGLDDPKRVLLGLLDAGGGGGPLRVSHARLRQEQRGPSPRHLLGAVVDFLRQLYALLLRKPAGDAREVDALEVPNDDVLVVVLGVEAGALDGSESRAERVGVRAGGAGGRDAAVDRLGGGRVCRRGRARGEAAGGHGGVHGRDAARVRCEAEGCHLLDARQRAQVRHRVDLHDPRGDIVRRSVGLLPDLRLARVGHHRSVPLLRSPPPASRLVRNGYRLARDGSGVDGLDCSGCLGPMDGTRDLRRSENRRRLGISRV
mmetsp:Transcript_9588/g.43670  ORF Transcript_9588/g.43670 Transcript_9588/m.43670 type:complete len:371 (-) Transcript_9588:90-1202(-)